MQERKEEDIIAGQIDLSKYYTPTDFDSPEVIEEIAAIQREISEVLEGAKIDPTKMLTGFNMRLAAKIFCQTAYPKVGFWTFPTNMDIFRAGIIYGSMAKLNNQSSQTTKP